MFALPKQQQYNKWERNAIHNLGALFGSPWRQLVSKNNLKGWELGDKLGPSWGPLASKFGAHCLTCKWFFRMTEKTILFSLWSNMGSILDLNCGVVALLLAHVEAK